MWRRHLGSSKRPAILIALIVAACGIAETKLPPEPTVEYLPCSGLGLEGTDRAEFPDDLRSVAPELESIWGGSWLIGERTHIGLTDVGAVDWETACAQIGHTDLVVHEVPFLLSDLVGWADTVADRIAGSSDPESASRELVVDAGQYVIEIRAETVEEAALLAERVPLEAWSYGGPPSSGSS
jgi:hypothetical protein